MADTLTCTECRAPIPKTSRGGYCPQCLLGLAATAMSEEAPHPAPAADLPAGPARGFGGYELLEKIGEGGMGIVYRARQPALDRIVALKLQRAGAWAAETEIKRFRTEAQSAARLNHPHIVAIHEVGESDGQHYFSMEFIEGKSLAETVGRTPLEPTRAARYVRTIAEAIQFAHERGVLHRDLKPANVLIDSADQPRVTDFGLAKQFDRPEFEVQASEMTASGAVLGTPSYMPPEQARGRRQEMGPASDVYSIGAILYDCLTARPPLRADTPVDTLRQVVEVEPAAPRLLNPKVPRDLETICLKCLAKAPSDRYSSARDLADDLGRFLRGEPIRARPVGLWNRAWRWARRNPAVAALGAGLAMVLTLLAVAAVFFRADTADSVRQGVRPQAITIGLELAERGEQVRVMASDRELLALILGGDRSGLTNRLESLYESTSAPDGRKRFENLHLQDASGEAIARFPPPRQRASARREARDYFTGATNQAGTYYFSRVYQSADDDLHKFGVSCAIKDPAGNIVGVLAAMVGTQKSEILEGLTAGNRKVVLAGRTDLSRFEGQSVALRDDHMIFWHSAFRPNESAVPVDDARVQSILSELLSTHGVSDVRFEWAYRDPVARRYPQFLGHWLAGFARVEGTPYVVIYQTPDHVVNALATASLVAVAAGLAAAAWWGVRKIRSARVAMRE